MSTATRPTRRRFGEILVSDGIVTSEQIEEALAVQKQTGEILGTILLDMGLVTEADIAKTVSLQYQIPFISLTNYELNEKLVELFPQQFLHKHKILPFDKLGDMLLLMVTEVPREEVLHEIPKLTHMSAALYIGYMSEVALYLNKLIPLETQTRGTEAKTRPGQTVTQKRESVAQPARKQEADELEGEVDAAEGAAEVSGVLAFGSSKSFLEELDSTWDSIFEQVQSKNEPKPKK